MDMTGEYLIAAPRDNVWTALNDPEVLKSCIAGCDELVRSGENEFSAHMTAKIGPVKAGFGGKVTLSDISAPHGYTITGEGQGGAAGFAKGSAKVVLEAQSGGKTTLLKYTAAAQIGGKLAQIGSRLVEGSAKKMADEFFAAFAAKVQTSLPATATSEEPTLEAALEQIAPPSSAPVTPAHIPSAHPAHAPQESVVALAEQDSGNSRGLIMLGGIVVVLLLVILGLFFF
jgi:carbon monoxide dehydrogenase subunit G